MDKASKYLALFIVLTTIVEISALIIKLNNSHNTLLYNIFSVIQLSLVTLFFQSAIKVFQRNNIGWIVICVSFITWIINAIFFQDITKILNTYFLFYESLCIVGMSLFFFYDSLLNDSHYSVLTPYYIFTSLLLLFWSVTFLYWILFLNLYSIIPQEKNSWLNIFLRTISLITYLGFGLVFLFYKRLQPARE